MMFRKTEWPSKECDGREIGTAQQVLTLCVHHLYFTSAKHKCFLSTKFFAVDVYRLAVYYIIPKNLEEVHDSV